LAIVLAGGASGLVLAQSAPPAQKSQQRDAIYGYRMMTEAERHEYREKMRNAKTVKERQTLRDEHRAAMQERMNERGVGPGDGRGRGPAGPGYGQGGGPAYGKGGPGAGFGKDRGPRGPHRGFGPGDEPGRGGSTAPGN
jgi:hypothetical protein